jgi:murein DD-endopeptidase MepM/ murein hydrolase activator NlpD
MSVLRSVILSFALLLFCVVSAENNNRHTSEKNTNHITKDTVQALVVNPTNPLYTQLKDLTGEQIIGLVDSLLDADYVPYELIREINEYAENHILQHDYYNSLTAFYDSTEYPAGSIYRGFNMQEIHPYSEDLSKNDTTITLTLVDSNNFCLFSMPIEGVITSNFGWRDGRNHNGIDIDLEVWDPVHAAFDGMVRIAQYHKGYGRVVVIRHYNGLETIYAHLHRFKVKEGDIVSAGQVIGLGGSSGRSTGSHLHFEVRFKGKPINPKSLIDFKESKLLSSELILTKTRWSYAAYPKGVKFYTIQPGDFLYKIAKQFGTSVSKICEMNGIKRNSVLIAGKKLRIG